MAILRQRRRRVANRRAETGIAGAMIGRAAMSAPWIFQQIETLLRDRRSAAARPQPAERWEMIQRHCRARRLQEWGSEEPAMRSMRARLMAYSKGFPGSKNCAKNFSTSRRCPSSRNCARTSRSGRFQCRQRRSGERRSLTAASSANFSSWKRLSPNARDQLQDRQRTSDQGNGERLAQTGFATGETRTRARRLACGGDRRRLLRFAIQDGFGRWTRRIATSWCNPKMCAWWSIRRARFSSAVRSLDYSDDLQKGGFKVTNPNAVAHCSCGESFRCMTDYFALFGQPRQPWLDPNVLKEKHHELTRRAHPDVRGQRSSEQLRRGQRSVSNSFGSEAAHSASPRARGRRKFGTTIDLFPSTYRNCFCKSERCAQTMQRFASRIGDGSSCSRPLAGKNQSSAIAKTN